MSLLRQNARLRKHGIWNWSLPAWAGRFEDGRTYNACKSAGICRTTCYARNGTYRIPAVLARHEANLRATLDDIDGWKAAMLAELDHPKFTGAWIRIHDSGDFHSTAYLLAWLDIARARPETGFYCYTKEVALFRQHVEPDPPENFRWIYSYGGTQDADLDPERDRVADVFPDEEAIQDAGWHSQAESDLLAVLGPAPVGIPANHIPRYTRLQNGRRWSDWQAEADADSAHRRTRPAPGS